MKTIIFGFVCFAIGLIVALKHINFIVESRTQHCVAQSFKDRELHTKAKYLCNNIQCYGFAVDSYVLACLTK